MLKKGEMHTEMTHKRAHPNLRQYNHTAKHIQQKHILEKGEYIEYGVKEECYDTPTKPPSKELPKLLLTRKSTPELASMCKNKNKPVC